MAWILAAACHLRSSFTLAAAASKPASSPASAYHEGPRPSAHGAGIDLGVHGSAGSGAGAGAGGGLGAGGPARPAALSL